MAMCCLGSRKEFSRNYDNLYWKGYDVAFLISRVEELLNEKRPELYWKPFTSEMLVEHDSLRLARAENNVDEITELMAELWEQAKEEYKATVSSEKLSLMDEAENAPNLNGLDELFRQIQALELEF